jgi:hypothetical protein
MAVKPRAAWTIGALVALTLGLYVLRTHPAYFARLIFGTEPGAQLSVRAQIIAGILMTILGIAIVRGPRVGPWDNEDILWGYRLAAKASGWMLAVAGVLSVLKALASTQH